MDLKLYDDFLRDLEDIEAFADFENYTKMKCLQLMPGTIIKRSFVRRFNPLRDMKVKEFGLKYRFTKENMRRIIELIRDDLEVDNVSLAAARKGKQVPIDLQIMAAIRCWGLSEHTDVTASVHQVTKQTLSKICRRVAAALSSKASRYIRMPATLAEKERVTSAFQSLAGMPQVIGAVAHFNVQPEARTQYNTSETYVKTDVSHYMHVQVVSDASYKIRDLDCRLCRSEYGRRAAASRIFSQTRIKERFETNEFRGRILLAGHDYKCTPCVFTPILNPNTKEEQAFNAAHTVTYAAANNCLQMWRQRFEILTSTVSGSYATVRNTIVALALLHNMALEWNEPNFFDIPSECTWSRSENLQVQPVESRPVKAADVQARAEFVKHNF